MATHANPPSPSSSPSPSRAAPAGLVWRGWWLVFAAFCASFAPTWAAAMPANDPFDGAPSNRSPAWSIAPQYQTGAPYNAKCQTGVTQYKAAQYKPASGIAPSGPKNRVWDFFADQFKTHRENSAQVTGTHQEKAVCSHEIVLVRTVSTGADPFGRSFLNEPGSPVRAAAAAAAENAGLDWVTATAKGSRPHPSTYMSVAERNAHAAAFNDGASRFMIKKNFDKYGVGQTDGTSFVMTHSEADQLWAKAGGNVRAIEDAIGLPTGFLQSNQLIRVDIPAPKRFGSRIPSGNEAGANPRWIAGGKGPDGYLEAVIDARRMKPGDYSWHELKY